MNKRGQMTTEQLVGWVIGLAILGILIWLIFFGGMDTIRGILSLKGTTSMDSIVTGCDAVASPPNQAFCAELKQTTLDGKTAYVTCNAAVVKAKMTRNTGVDCSSYTSDLVAACKLLKVSNVKVNEITITAAASCDSLTA